VGDEKAWRSPIHKVGVIGLNETGQSIARRLARESQGLGLKEIVGFDPDASRRDRLNEAGITAVTSVAHLADMADLILLCLPTSADVAKTVRAHDGLLDCVRQGQIIVDHSWSTLELTKQVATAFSSRGAAFLDAPISRCGDISHDIETGRLVIAIGGDEAALEACLSVLRCLARDITLVGQPGSAQAIRQLSDLITLQTFSALAEALTTAEALGIDGHDLVEALARASGGKASIGRQGLMEFLGAEGTSVADVKRPSITDAAARLKDAIQLAEQKDIALTSAGSTLTLLHTAEEQGLGEEDLSRMLDIIRPKPPQRRS